MSYIYKITNQINNKSYVGYTNNTIERRFYLHCYEANKYKDKDNSILHRAIFKYGKENFKIKVLEEFNENEKNWEELEKYYIKKENTIRPNGYNILEGGNKPPIHYGNDNIKTKLRDEDLPLVHKMLQDNTISYNRISKITGLSIRYLHKINNGEHRKNPKLSYPLRKNDIYEERALNIIEILANDTTLSNEKIAKKFGIRKNEVAAINQGSLYKYLWNGSFPIRKVLVPNDYEEKQKKAKEVCNYILKTNIHNKAQLQKDTNTGRYVLDKIIKGVYPYNLINQSYPLF